MKTYSSTPSLFLILIWVALILGCANRNNQTNSQQTSNSNNQVASQPPMRPVVDIPQLINKSPAELDKVLGKPIRVTKITNDPEMMPGEYRDYKIGNSTGALTEDGL